MRTMISKIAMVVAICTAQVTYAMPYPGWIDCFFGPGEIGWIPFTALSSSCATMSVPWSATSTVLTFKNLVAKKLIEAKPEALNFLNTGEMQPKLQEVLNDSEIQFLNEDGSAADTAEQKAQSLVRSVQLIEQQAAQELQK